MVSFRREHEYVQFSTLTKMLYVPIRKINFLCTVNQFKSLKVAVQSSCIDSLISTVTSLSECFYRFPMLAIFCGKNIAHKSSSGWNRFCNDKQNHCKMIWLTWASRHFIKQENGWWTSCNTCSPSVHETPPSFLLVESRPGVSRFLIAIDSQNDIGSRWSAQDKIIGGHNVSDARLASACGQHRAVCVCIACVGSTPAKYSKLFRSPASFIQQISSKSKQKNHHRANKREKS